MVQERRQYDEVVDDLILGVQLKTLEFQTYTPSQGERWDNLAAATEVFSNPYAIEILKRFNPEYANRLILGPDTPMRIPLFRIQDYVNINSLPPWDPRRRQVL